jgi:hypothetical protein
MGLETAIAFAAVSAASGVYNASQQTKQAKKAAQTQVVEGDLRASELAKKAKASVASQRVSFLNSGLSLEGTPLSVMESTLSSGLEDVTLTQSNAQQAAKNTIAAGRSAAISSVLSGFTQAGSIFAGGGGFSGMKQPTLSPNQITPMPKGSTVIPVTGTTPWSIPAAPTPTIRPIR